jgi:hypothetical protein
MIGLATVLTIAACTDVPAPRGQEGGGEGFESRKAQEEVDAPKADKGVVPDVLLVALDDAEKVIEKSGFTVGEAEPLGTFGSRSVASLVCEQDPAAGETPPEGTPIILIFDRKC